jgi:hypothetical protein
MGNNGEGREEGKSGDRGKKDAKGDRGREVVKSMIDNRRVPNFIRDTERREVGRSGGHTEREIAHRNIDMAHGSASGCLKPDM